MYKPEWSPVPPPTTALTLQGRRSNHLGSTALISNQDPKYTQEADSIPSVHMGQPRTPSYQRSQSRSHWALWLSRDPSTSWGERDDEVALCAQVLLLEWGNGSEELSDISQLGFSAGEMDWVTLQKLLVLENRPWGQALFESAGWNHS